MTPIQISRRELESLENSVAIHEPTIGTSPVAQQKNTSHVALSLCDHPLVLEM